MHGIGTNRLLDMYFVSSFSDILSQIMWFWNYRISAEIPVFHGRVNNYGYELEKDKS